MNKQLYDFTQDKLQKSRQGGQIKNSVLTTKLYEDYNFGQFDLSKQWLSFSLENILALSEEIKSSLGVDIRHDAYPDKQSRETNAANNRSEKDNSYAVSKDFILINSLSKININQKSLELAPLTSLGIYVKADDIITIEHKTIILVENLAVMANLSALNLASHAEELTEALWVYRGDIKKQQHTGTAYQFFRRFEHHKRVCFSDVDPKGIEIAITSHADYWLTIKSIDEYINTLQELKGTEKEWFEQNLAIKFLQRTLTEQQEKKSDWQNIFTVGCQRQKTLKQEHIVAHKLALTLLKLS
ncbi:DUF7281 domain-containing protein [Colwellia ponticola]|uniref:DUF7281 domain-containing protein n=1 Tax=Colwellia ponticola TaxID=2304625 RepID=A0A8H2JKD3_9GAMM|nr:hypothetical protein [Colwellia ponticola]TMM44042.1 hypothetical protein FCS21_11615 [Colwellia ponticola]